MEQVKDLLGRQKGILSAADRDMSGQDFTRRSHEPQCSACSDTGWVPSPVEGRVMKCECKKRRIAQGRISEILKNWPEYKDARLETIKPRSVRQRNAIQPFVRIRQEAIFWAATTSRAKRISLWLSTAGWQMPVCDAFSFRRRN